MKKISITLGPKLLQKLKREARDSQMTVDRRAQFILETWLNENLDESRKLSEEIGKQLGSKLATAFDEAVQELATSDKSEWTVRVRKSEGRKRRK